jgi:hypothetical protein
MPAHPTLKDFFLLRFSPIARSHLLQSARVAREAPDYRPPDYLRREHEAGRRHRWYMTVPADILAATLICLVPGYLLQLAILGPDAVDGVPGAVRALWPG